MRILHVINSLNGGGAERLVSELLPIFKAQNVIVDLLVLSAKDIAFEQSLSRVQVKVMYISKNRVFMTPLVIYKLSRIMKDYDIVHSHLFPSQYIVVLANMIMMKRRKLVTTEHSTNNKRRRYPFLKSLEHFIYSSYDKIISISAATQQALQDAINITAPGKFLVIENGIDVEFFSGGVASNLASVPHLAAGPKDLIMVAGFTEAKDHKTIIQAMLLLPHEFKLTLVGTGPLIEKAQLLVRRLDLESRITFLGFRKDVVTLVKSSYISILSSHWEGFGLVALEAMAAGIPVIASDVGGLGEVVRDAGLLFVAGDEKSLANAILDLDHNPSKYREVVDLQLQRVVKYDIKQSAWQHIHLYRSLMHDE